MAKSINRRKFNSLLGKGVSGGLLAANLPLACAMGQEKKKKLGVALVGLGGYSTYHLAPALQETEHCYLAGIVTGTPSKEKVWARRYGIPTTHIFNYSNFDAIKENKDIDVVYVVLPNSMHAAFSVRAAMAGKHVICEKPMGLNVAECDEIIRACADQGVKLGMGYRLHSEPYTKEVKRLVREKTFGEIEKMSSDAAYVSRGNPDQWRLNKKLSGGGALMNMGCYAFQGLIYGCGRNPIRVKARHESTRPNYFKDTDETVYADFDFGAGLMGKMMTSHNYSTNRLRIDCSKGWIELDPASTYIPLAGKTSRGKLDFVQESQQKLQMDDFAKHILYDEPNVAPGEKGRRDLVIIEAIYKSLKNNGSWQSIEVDTKYGIVTS